MPALSLPLSALDVSDQATLVFWVILGLLGLAKGVESVFNIYRSTRKTPGPDETYATKKELGEYMHRTDARLDGIDNELNGGLEKLRTTLSSEMSAVQRALGRLEGQIGQALISAQNNISS